MCKHLDEGVSGEAGLFSVDSLDPPIFSGLLLGEQCPDGEKHDNISILVFSVQSQEMHIGKNTLKQLYKNRRMYLYEWLLPYSR